MQEYKIEVVVHGIDNLQEECKHPANPSCRFAQAQSLGRQRCGSSSPIRL